MGFAVWGGSCVPDAAPADSVGCAGAVGKGVGGTTTLQAARRNEPITAGPRQLRRVLAKRIALLLSALEDAHGDDFGSSGHLVS